MMEGKNLVIVESPGKIDKIKKALGSDYKVMASIGHIRDLDESGLSIDIADGFKPTTTVYQTQKQFFRDAIDECSSIAKNFEDFQSLLLEKYNGKDESDRD